MVRLLWERVAGCLCCCLWPLLGELGDSFPRAAKGGELGNELLQAPGKSPVQGNRPPQMTRLHVTHSGPKTVPSGETSTTSLLESGHTEKILASLQSPRGEPS